MQNVKVVGNLIIYTNEKGEKQQIKTHNFPHNPEPFFGRMEIIKKLHKQLNENRTLLLVNGIGGIGKTTVAQRYVNMSEYAKNYNFIFYFTVVTKLADDYIREIQDALKLSAEDFFNIPETEKLKKIKNKLDNKTGNNLLIIDNANEHEQLSHIKKFLPAANWKTLITSRAESTEIPKIQIDELEPENARKLFSEHYKNENAKDITKLDALLKHINYHTLLTELLAKAGYENMLEIKEIYEAIISKDGYGHDDLQQTINPGLHSDMKTEEKEVKLKEYISALYKPEKLSEEEKQLLIYFAVLPAKNIDIEILRKLFIENENENTFFDNKNKLQIELKKLQKKGYINRYNKTYKIHQIIQDIVKDKLKPNIKNCLPIIYNLANIFNTDDYGNRLDFAKYLPFSESIITNSENKNFTRDNTGLQHLAILLNNSAAIYEALANYKIALEFNKKALKIFKQVLSEKHPSLAASYNSIAVAYTRLGYYEKSLKFHKKAIEIIEQALPKNRINLATYYDNIAGTYQEFGNYKTALEFNKKAIEIREQIYKDKKHPSLAISYNNITKIYYRLKQYKNAKKYIELAVEIFEQTLPKGHPNIKIVKGWQEGINKEL